MTNGFRITMLTVAESNMPLEYDLSLLEHFGYTRKVSYILNSVEKQKNTNNVLFLLQL